MTQSIDSTNPRDDQAPAPTEEAPTGLVLQPGPFRLRVYTVPGDAGILILRDEEGHYWQCSAERRSPETPVGLVRLNGPLPALVRVRPPELARQILAGLGIRTSGDASISHKRLKQPTANNSLRPRLRVQTNGGIFCDPLVPQKIRASGFRLVHSQSHPGFLVLAKNGLVLLHLRTEADGFECWAVSPGEDRPSGSPEVAARRSEAIGFLGRTLRRYRKAEPKGQAKTIVAAIKQADAHIASAPVGPSASPGVGYQRQEIFYTTGYVQVVRGGLPGLGKHS